MSAPTTTPQSIPTIQPLWFYAGEPGPDEEDHPRDCFYCPRPIRVGALVAYLPIGGDGALVCLDCGCAAEDAAYELEQAASRDNATAQHPAVTKETDR